MVRKGTVGSTESEYIVAWKMDDKSEDDADG